MPSLHNDPYINASLAGAAARREAFKAKWAAMTPEQQAAYWDDQREQSERRQRARSAYHCGRRAPRRPRYFREAPMPSRQYVTMSTESVRDPRLSKTGVALLAELCALAGTTGYTDATNEALGKLISRSRSTIKRCINDLTEFGYVTSELIHTRTGSVKCRRLKPTDRAWPYWHPKRENPQESCGSTKAPDITNPLKGESMESGEAEETLRAIVRSLPQTAETARESGRTLDQTVDSIIKLLARGDVDLVYDTEGYRLVPLRPPPRKKRLFRP